MVLSIDEHAALAAIGNTPTETLRDWLRPCAITALHSLPKWSKGHLIASVFYYYQKSMIVLPYEQVQEQEGKDNETT